MMEYKLSKYNHFREYGDIVIGLNYFKKILFAVSIEKYHKLIEYKNLEILKNDYPSFFSAMFKLGVIEDNKDNNLIKEILLFRNRKEVFDSKSYDLTIIPTLNCNFDCWYCYETDRPKYVMKQEVVDSIVKFIDKKSKFLSNLLLDWYGGEPLLCFSKILKPLSEKIADICAYNDVKLLTSLTTNGYLIEKSMLPTFKKINMQSFQITLNGDKEIHNKTRSPKNKNDSYDKIVNNIIMIAEELNPKELILRINLAREYFDSVTNIIQSFPVYVRKKIMVSIHQIDQDIDRFTADEIEAKLNIFESEGFNINFRTHLYINRQQYSCSADKYNQAIINYDGRIFKCHAVNFEKENEVGIIENSGEIRWEESLLSTLLNKASFDNDICLDCKYLPICPKICSYKQSLLPTLKGTKCVASEIESCINRIMNEFKNSDLPFSNIFSYINRKSTNINY